MPGSPDDDDAPRWELTWEPQEPEAPPRWGPAGEVPRWDPGPETTRSAPPLPAAPPAGHSRLPAPGAVPEATTGRPAAWWRRHPWFPLWGLVLGLPPLGVALRLLDEAGLERVVTPLASVYAILAAAALVAVGVARWRRSPLRLALGVLGAGAATVLLLGTVTQVTLGRTPCPSRAGSDLGASIAAAGLEAWRQGRAGDEGWRDGLADAGWSARTRALGMLDYSLVRSGCWERIAPVDAGLTWHEYRVTVRAGEGSLLSKVVIVHTARAHDARWTITAIEGPLP